MTNTIYTFENVNILAKIMVKEHNISRNDAEKQAEFMLKYQSHNDMSKMRKMARNG